MEMTERQAGLYFNCDDPFTTNHKCKNPFNIMAVDNYNTKDSNNSLNMMIYASKESSNGNSSATKHDTNSTHEINTTPEIVHKGGSPPTTAPSARFPQPIADLNLPSGKISIATKSTLEILAPRKPQH